jgi:hypothetical protein
LPLRTGRRRRGKQSWLLSPPPGRTPNRFGGYKKVEIHYSLPENRVQGYCVSITVVLPVYNEERDLPPLLERTVTALTAARGACPSQAAQSHVRTAHEGADSLSRSSGLPLRIPRLHRGHSAAPPEGVRPRARSRKQVRVHVRTACEAQGAGGEGHGSAPGAPAQSQAGGK